MNDAMHEYWNADAGRTWAALQARLDRSLSPVTAALLSHADPKPGEAVLDIGCGSGETTLALAAATGDAHGVDISKPLLAVAEARADSLESLATFEEGDAAAIPGDNDYDLIISRFGVMFFDDPVAAFANIRSHAAPGGRLRFACWRSPRENGWTLAPMQALAPLMPPADNTADPHAPGPFALADPERLAGILSDAGWQDVDLQRFDFEMLLGEDSETASALENAVDFSLQVGPAARLVREQGESIRTAAAAALHTVYAPHAAKGRVALPASVWLVAASA
jgi:SAM-dependent methyltransferase